jgi:hypothetical protein
MPCGVAGSRPLISVSNGSVMLEPAAVLAAFSRNPNVRTTCLTCYNSASAGSLIDRQQWW